MELHLLCNRTRAVNLCGKELPLPASTCASHCALRSQTITLSLWSHFQILFKNERTCLLQAALALAVGRRTQHRWPGALSLSPKLDVCSMVALLLTQSVLCGEGVEETADSKKKWDTVTGNARAPWRAAREAWDINCGTCLEWWLAKQQASKLQRSIDDTKSQSSRQTDRDTAEATHASLYWKQFYKRIFKQALLKAHPSCIPCKCLMPIGTFSLDNVNSTDTLPLSSTLRNHAPKGRGVQDTAGTSSAPETRHSSSSTRRALHSSANRGSCRRCCGGVLRWRWQRSGGHGGKRGATIPPQPHPKTNSPQTYTPVAPRAVCASPHPRADVQPCVPEVWSGGASALRRRLLGAHRARAEAAQQHRRCARHRAAPPGPTRIYHPATAAAARRSSVLLRLRLRLRRRPMRCGCCDGVACVWCGPWVKGRVCVFVCVCMSRDACAPRRLEEATHARARAQGHTPAPPLMQGHPGPPLTRGPPRGGRQLQR